MKNLTQRNADLLIEGVGMMGTMEEGYGYVEERLYINDADELNNFCVWVDENAGCCASGNIQMLWKAFKNPTKENMKPVNELMEWWEEYKL